MAKDDDKRKGGPEELTPTEAAKRIGMALKADAKVKRILAAIEQTDSEMEEKKGELKALREKLERAYGQLRGAVKGVSVEQQDLPFAAQAPKDDSWRKVSIDKLEISDTLKQCLKDASIQTMGDLADFSNDERKHKGRGLMEIKGVGEAAEAKIGDALTFFWAKFARQTGENKKPEEGGKEN